MISTVLKKRFQNQLTKVSDYKQAVQLAVGQLASKTVTGSQAQKICWAQSTMGIHSVGFPEPAHNGNKHWPPLWTTHFCRTQKSTTETHSRETSFVSWFHLVYGLEKLELSPENKLVFIKLANAFFPGTWGRHSAMQKHTGNTIQPQNYQDLLQQDCTLWTQGHPQSFVCFLFSISTLNILLL